MDALTRAVSETAGLRLAFVDVSESAQTLAQRHLSGPVAGRALGHGLAAAAFLSTHLKNEDHAILLQLRGDGPIGGLSAEVWGLDKLRGFTQRKLLQEFDGEPDVDIPAIFGAQGTLSVVHSTSREVVYQGVVQPRPPTVRAGLARYYRDSLQTPAAVEIVSSGVENVETVRGLMVEKLPGCDTEAFVGVLERFNDGRVRAALSAGADLEALAALLELGALSARTEQPLSFACRCSAAKVLGVLAALPQDELREIAAGDEPQDVTCHFCGETYRIRPEEVGKLVAQLPH